MSEELVKKLVDDMGGTLNEIGRLPDGSGFATASFPLPKDHWAYHKPIPGEYEAPPMSLRLGAGKITVVTHIPNEESVLQLFTREEFAEKIREAGRYAYRSSTDSGKEQDLDPDALLQNLVVAFLGYWTTDGLSSDDWANPPHLRKKDDAAPPENLTEAEQDAIKRRIFGGPVDES